MDINELNKMSVTALFSKLTAQPNTAAGAGNAFASLLGQPDAADMLPGVSEDIRPVENKPAGNVEAKVRPDNGADKSKETAPAEKNNKKVDNKKPVKTDDSKAAVKKDNVNTVEEEVSGEDDKAGEAKGVDVVMMMVPVAEPLAPTAEAEGVNPSEAVIAVDGAMADGAALEGSGTVGAEAGALPADSINILDANGNKIEDFAVNPADLVKQPVVKVFDNTDGQVKEMSGVELSARIFGVEETNQALVAAGMPELPVEAAADVADMAQQAVTAPEAAVIDGKNFGEQVKEAVKTAVVENVEQTPVEEGGAAEAVVAAAVKSAGHQTKAETAPVADGDEVVADTDVETEIQAAELDKMLNGRQVKVEVNVDEEKIAYRSGQDLVKDRVALDKALAAADDAVSVNQTPASAGNATAAPMAVQNNMPAQAVAPVNVQTVAAAADDAAPQTTSVAEVGGISSGVAGHAAGASGSEFVNAAKAEANNKTNDASFRDVYKGMSKEAVDQVKVNITKSAVKGVDTIDVHLKPEELGRIEIKMHIKDGKLQAHIVSSRPETMEALQKEAQSLERAFNDAGFQTDENSLSFSCRDDGQQANQRQEHENQLRQFIGEVFETEANGEILSAEAANQNWTAEKGLNIKV